jgi:hypothetical protein
VFLEMPATLDFCVVATDVVDRRAGAAFRNALSSQGGYIFTHSSESLLLNPNAPQMFDSKGNGIFSTVLLDWIEWEGPLVSEAEKARRLGAAGDNHGANLGVGIACCQGMAQFIHQSVVQGVELLGSIERDQPGASALLDDQCGVIHGLVLI